MHDTSVRKPTVGGTVSVVHDAPPFDEVTTAAPFGAPSTPTVEPVATQRVALGQSTASRELTGGGSETGTNPPCHGESAATVEGAEVVRAGVLDVQAPAAAAKAMDATTASLAPHERRGGDAGTRGLPAGRRCQRTRMT
jgi:hypothetical protein